MNVKKWSSLILAVVMVVAIPTAFAEESEEVTKADYKRSKIDATAKETLDLVLEKGPKAKELYDKAFAYAVFDNLKLSFGISGGGGAGVAVEKKTGAKTYMKMGTAGLNLGLGGQKYQVLFLFQDSITFENFVKKGWEADTSAQAVGGTAGANVATTFKNGMAVFQITEGGLMLTADISGTKYWNYEKLNKDK